MAKLVDDIWVNNAFRVGVRDRQGGGEERLPHLSSPSLFVCSTDLHTGILRWLLIVISLAC